jgi:putative peptide zinc metalloprotease protein
MAVAWAIVQDELADERNEAHAYASCDACAAIAAAFQVLLLVGDPDVVVPVNAAVAATYECNQCQTAAVAVQLVVSLTDLPSPEATTLIDQALNELAALEAHLGSSLSVEEVYLAMTATSAEVLQILMDEGVTPEWVQQGGTTPTPGPATEPSPTAPEPTPSSQASPEAPSPEASPPTPAPGDSAPTAEPSPSQPAPDPSQETPDEPPPEPSPSPDQTASTAP